MKANELMIGNLFKIENKIYTVCGINHEGSVIIDTDEDWLEKDVYIEPIHITEEWLANNGFEKFYDDICEFSYYTKEVDGNYIDIKTDCSNTSEDHVVCHVDNCDRCTIGSADIQYVHQLQNFLTILNIEMEVKL